MAIPTRIIKRRIKSIRSTGKIMKAMELVSASKMRKATQLTLATRPYARMIQETAEELGKQTRPELYPYLVGYPRPQGREPSVLVVIIASDRGLCGGFNSQLLKKTIEFVQTRHGQSVRVITVGSRAENAVRRAQLPIIASFASIANAPAFERAQPIADLILEEFAARRADLVFMAYTDFKSALSQIPSVHQLLPVFSEADLPKYQNMIDTARSGDEETEDRERKESSEQEILFEPGADQVMKRLLPRMIEVRMYQAFLESAASEHSARMMAMRSAGDAAKDMQETLTFTLNQARQASITREISEISAGKAALE